VKRLAILLALAIAASACGSRPIIIVTPTPLPPTIVATSTRTPTATPLSPTLEPTAAPAVEVEPAGAGPTAPASSFADMPGNQARGEPAPDFTARVLGGGTFTLSAQRGSYVLILPTIIGCGECLFSLSEISAAYPDYRGQGVQAVILNLDVQDMPESWQEYAEYFAEPEFIWGAVDSQDFLVDYNIRTLGTKVLIDPDGRMVYWNEYPLLAEGFAQLFDLATQ
jgi:hypothetical protein